MIKTIEGKLTVENEKFCIVVARFNEFITSKLLAGAVDELVRHGAKKENITIVWAPGAFEIPILTKKLAKSGNYDAIIALGAIIRGATPHFDYVSSELTKGIASVGLDTGVPVIFGVLTTENIEQAIERAGTKAGNKGSDAAKSAIEMANLIKLV